MTEQAPEAFPVPGDVLAEAEQRLREHLPPGTPVDDDDRALVTVMAEYERRGRIVEAATALVATHHSVVAERIAQLRAALAKEVQRDE